MGVITVAKARVYGGVLSTMLGAANGAKEAHDSGRAREVLPAALTKGIIWGGVGAMGAEICAHSVNAAYDLFQCLVSKDPSECSELSMGSHTVWAIPSVALTTVVILSVWRATYNRCKPSPKEAEAIV